MMKIAALAAAVVLASPAAPAEAQTPDFSGTWRLDRDASDWQSPSQREGREGRRKAPTRGGRV